MLDPCRLIPSVPPHGVPAPSAHAVQGLDAGPYPSGCAKVIRPTGAALALVGLTALGEGPEGLIQPLPHGAVAFACSFLERRAIDDLNQTATVANHAG